MEERINALHNAKLTKPSSVLRGAAGLAFLWTQISPNQHVIRTKTSLSLIIYKHSCLVGLKSLFYELDVAVFVCFSFLLESSR